MVLEDDEALGRLIERRYQKEPWSRVAFVRPAKFQVFDWPPSGERAYLSRGRWIMPRWRVQEATAGLATGRQKRHCTC